MNPRQQKSAQNAPTYPKVVLRMLQAYGTDSLPGLAQALDVSVNTIKSWVQRSSVPLEYLRQTAATRGFSVDWLIGLTDFPGLAQVQDAPTQQGAFRISVAEPGPLPWTRPRTGPAPQPQGADAALIAATSAGAARPLLMRLPTGPGDADYKEFEIIPRVVRVASAGPGVPDPKQGVDVIDLAGDMAFSYDWLRHNLGNTSGRIASIKVRGDSMSPTLLDGDTILIDQDVRTVDVDGIYVLDLYGRRLVKRVQQLFDGSLVLISDNPAYQREQLPRDRARDVGVLGRMVWPRVR